MSMFREILDDTWKFLTWKQKLARQPIQRVELMVEVSFETFVQVCYTDGSGKYKIKDFTGKSWKTEILLYEERDVLFSVFVNNHLLKKDQHLVMIKKVNEEITGKKRIELSDTLHYEGWFRLS